MGVTHRHGCRDFGAGIDLGWAAIRGLAQPTRRDGDLSRGRNGNGLGLGMDLQHQAIGFGVFQFPLSLADQAQMFLVREGVGQGAEEQHPAISAHQELDEKEPEIHDSTASSMATVLSAQSGRHIGDG